MPITRSSEIPAREMMVTLLHFLASPANGASETLVLRGVIPVGASFPAHSHDR